MKALVVSPYFNHIGGGERYMLTLASILEELNYEVHYGWDKSNEIADIANQLNIKIRTPKCDPYFAKHYHQHNPITTYLRSKKYDITVYLSDGSIPLLGSKTNILHLQVPFRQAHGQSWKNIIKKTTITDFIVNSKFTKNIIDDEYKVNSIVLYPPVVPVPIVAKKKKIILSVGRFDPSLNVKQHNVMIEAFKKLSPKIPGWKLVLAGGSENRAWIDQLRSLADTYPIRFVTNASYQELSLLYAKARIYWHANGYAVNELKNPELTEHFGMSTVEAISAKAIPLVVPLGGQKEIVSDPALHWLSIEELVSKTIDQINSPTRSLIDISPYSLLQFKTKFTQLISS